MKPAPLKLPGELAREALGEAPPPAPYLVKRAPVRLNVSPAIADVTGSRGSSGVAIFLAGAACAALLLLALYFSL